MTGFPLMWQRSKGRKRKKDKRKNWPLLQHGRATEEGKFTWDRQAASIYSVRQAVEFEGAGRVMFRQLIGGTSQEKKTGTSILRFARRMRKCFEGRHRAMLSRGPPEPGSVSHGGTHYKHSIRLPLFKDLTTKI